MHRDLPAPKWRPTVKEGEALPAGYDPTKTWADYHFPVVEDSVKWNTPPGEPVIKVENLGVEFLRGRKRNLSLREIIFTGRSQHQKETFWALRNLNFTVGRGEAVGLVGGNGGGKSTLLKMIAGTLLPDEGSATVTEGVAPLIELTGGFVSEISARENVYLMGGLHGMTREEMDDRFDDIIDFAGPAVRDGLDVPYRHFSSGMQIRLGFAVITTLDEPIILVDEVLAVGDAAFREKCYTRMENLIDQGRTLFLVSHSEPDLMRFCTRGLYLKDGGLHADGPMDEVIEQYSVDVMEGKREPLSPQAFADKRAQREDQRIRRRLQRDEARRDASGEVQESEGSTDS